MSQPSPDTVSQPPCAREPSNAREGARAVFGNGTAHSRDQHRCLADAYDPVTLPRLAATGVGPGWRCPGLLALLDREARAAPGRHSAVDPRDVGEAGARQHPGRHRAPI